MQFAGGKLQDELARSALSDLNHIRQLDNSVRNLVSLILGVEPQTLSGLLGVSGSDVGSASLVKVSFQVLQGESIILEVEEPLGLVETV